MCCGLANFGVINGLSLQRTPLEDGKPFATPQDGSAFARGYAKPKLDPKDDPNSAKSGEGSVHGIGSDPTGSGHAGAPSKPSDGFGDAAPGNAKAATTPVGG